MRIQLTPEQAAEFAKDGWLSVDTPDNQGFIYVEISDGPDYFELGKGKDKVCISSDDILRLKPRRTRDPSFYQNDPLCPSCGTYMIYNFNYCPKCGQKIDYSEEHRI